MYTFCCTLFTISASPLDNNDNVMVQFMSAYVQWVSRQVCFCVNKVKSNKMNLISFFSAVIVGSCRLVGFHAAGSRPDPRHWSQEMVPAQSQDYLCPRNRLVGEVVGHLP